MTIHEVTIMQKKKKKKHTLACYKWKTLSLPKSLLTYKTGNL